MRKLLTAFLLLASVPAFGQISFSEDNCVWNGSGSSGTVEVPAVSTLTYSDGDILVAFHNIQEDGFTNRINESGWTEIVSTDTATGVNDKSIAVFWKEADNESGTYTFDATTDASGEPISGMICVGENISTSTPIDVSAVVGPNSENSGGFDAGSITPVTDGAAVMVAMFGSGCDTVTSETPPSGYSTIRDDPTAPGVSNSCIFAAYKEVDPAAAEDPGNWSFTESGGGKLDSSGFTIAFRPAASNPTFTAGPTESTNTSTTVDFTFTSDTTGDVHWALRNPGVSAYADCDAIQTGTNAILTGSEAVTATVADSDTVTFTYPEGDIDFCIDDGSGGQSAVSTLSAVQRNPCSGCAFAEIASALGSTSPLNPPSDSACDTTDGSRTVDGCSDTSRFSAGSLVDVSAGFATDGPCVVLSKTSSSLTFKECEANSTTANITVLGLIESDGSNTVNPVPAAGDIMEYEVAHANGCDDDDGDGNTETCVTFTNEWELDPVNFDTGEENDFVIVNVTLLQDISGTDATPTFDAPLNADFDFYLNNEAPVLDGEVYDLEALPITPTAIDTQDYDAICTNPNLTPSTELHTDSSLAASLSFSGGEVSGTVDAENESGFSFKVLCGAGLWDVAQMTQYPIDTWTVPDGTGDTVAAWITALDSAAPWFGGDITVSTSGACSTTVAADDIISQTPTESSEASATPSFSAVVSLGETTPNCEPVDSFQIVIQFDNSIKMGL